MGKTTRIQLVDSRQWLYIVANIQVLDRKGNIWHPICHIAHVSSKRLVCGTRGKVFYKPIPTLSSHFSFNVIIIVIIVIILDDIIS